MYVRENTNSTHRSYKYTPLYNFISNYEICLCGIFLEVWMRSYKSNTEVSRSFDFSVTKEEDNSTRLGFIIGIKSVFLPTGIKLQHLQARHKFGKLR